MPITWRSDAPWRCAAKAGAPALRPIFHGSRAALEKKPPHGQPCTSCGLCCMATRCELGASIFGQKIGRCPALIMRDGVSSCGVVEHPELFDFEGVAEHGEQNMREAALYLTYAGLGCDARFNGEPPDQNFYRAMARYDIETRHTFEESKRLWRMK